jgi:hypothetical protein
MSEACQFINVASGSDDLKLGTGESNVSCTTDVASSREFPFDHHNVVLLDTPGFDNTQKKDFNDIISEIQKHLNTK